MLSPNFKIILPFMKAINPYRFLYDGQRCISSCMSLCTTERGGSFMHAAPPAKGKGGGDKGKGGGDKAKGAGDKGKKDAKKDAKKDPKKDAKKDAKKDPCAKDKKEKEETFMDPACKIAIVTGGATGIGYAACCHLLCQGAKHVVIGGINRKEGLNAVNQLNGKFGSDKACFMNCDVTNECEFDSLFKETQKSFGHVDILFNNAGMLEGKRWSLMVDTNLKGTIIGCFLAFKYMAKTGDCGRGGLVVNNASVLGFQPCSGAPVYTATKHAVVGLTRSLGADFHYKKTKLRVCAICPGVTHTNLVTGAKERQVNDEWGAETDRQLKSMPQQTIGDTGESFMYILRHGKSGENYISEGGELLHAKIPDRKTFSAKLRSFKKK